MITALMFRLLPVQVVLVMVGAVNGLVSGFFASNYVGINAMTAVGLFLPVTTFTNAVSTLLVGGAAILCGKYMGQNEQEKLQNLFILDLIHILIRACHISNTSYIHTDTSAIYSQKRIQRIRLPHHP